MPPMPKLRLTLVLVSALVALGGLVGSSSASAAGLSPPVADCSAHGRLTHHYSTSQLRTALATMPADIAEYTTCPDVIRRALLAGIGPINPGGSGGGRGSFLPAWLIAVLVVLVLGGAAAGAISLRNRR